MARAVTAAFRAASPGDAAAIAAIYAPYVRDTAITFEEEAPDASEMARRIAVTTARCPWLVAEDGGALLGYAYAHPFHARGAYRWTCETTIYLADHACGRGLGRALYGELLAQLRSAGFAAALALVTEPNPASARLHEALGFARVGLLGGVGFKHGAWLDVAYWQKDLAPRAPVPRETGG